MWNLKAPMDYHITSISGSVGSHLCSLAHSVAKIPNLDMDDVGISQELGTNVIDNEMEESMELNRLQSDTK